MTKFITSIPYFITGHSREALKHYDQHSRSKPVLFTVCLFLPAALWFLTGMLVTYNIYQLPVGMAIIAGLLMSAVVFALDWVIINMSKNVFASIVRIALALCIAILGGLLLDTIIFGKDIEQAAIKQYVAKREAELGIQQGRVDTAGITLNKEMKGEGSKLGAGYGKVAEKNDSALAREIRTLENSQAAWAAEKDILNNDAHSQYRQKLAELNLVSLAHRMEHLNALKLQFKDVKLTWWLLLIIMVTLELVPLIAKLTSRASAYELDQEAYREILEMRRRQVMEKQRFYAKQPALARQAGKLIGQNTNN